MAMVINTNISSLNAQRQLGASANKLGTAMERLSSGLRINSAKDDAAGLAISSRMTTQITGLNVAQRNANDGISLAQTAEGALSTIGNNLQRIRELAVQSRNATNSDDDRAALQKEVTQLTEEIDRVAKNTSFNGTNLLDGSFTNKSFQVGANQGQTIDIASVVNAQTSNLGQWKSVAESAELKGLAMTAATPAADTTGKLELTNTGTTAADFGYAETKVKLGNGTEITVAAESTANKFATAAEAKQGLADAIVSKLQSTAGALPEGVTATSKNGEVQFTNNTPEAVAITASGGATKTDAGAGTPAFAATTGAAELAVNGVAIVTEATMSTSVSDRQAKLAEAINKVSLQTGVTAAVNGGRLDLTSKIGNITVTGTAAAANGLSDVATTNYKAGQDKTGFSDVDVSTVANADNAILAMDAALKSVNSARADLGAIQNRFESVVTNLATTSENLTASRSRILDADFAVETANLSSAQVLQQAGTAMVAQANQLPQNVLSLLR